MDGRRGYADDAQPQWHAGQQAHPDQGWERRGDGGWRDEDLRVPEARTYPEARTVPDRPYQPRPVDSPTNPLSAVSPGAPSMSGPPAPAAPPMSGAPHMSGPPQMGGPPPGVPGPVPAPPREGVYRTRRPALAVLYLIGVAVFEWPAVRLFADGALGDDLSGSHTVSGIFLMIGLPLFARGLFALQAGAGKMIDARAGQAWLQPPIAYFTAGLALLIAAGLAAS